MAKYQNRVGNEISEEDYKKLPANLQRRYSKVAPEVKAPKETTDKKPTAKVDEKAK
ncbi:MAG: hypothetical protein KC589_09235 [Nanoarchaeota archaeon]|nr:hypothetical protein [Nanoarchaeota archaeon]